MKETDGVEPLRVIAQNPWEKKESTYNTSSEVWGQECQKWKVKASLYTVEVVVENHSYCDSHWHSSQSLNYHIYNSHKASDRYCDICGTFLKNSYYLERHRKQVHFKIHDFICDHCGKSFPFKVTRDNHVNVAHLKELKYSCDKCDYKALTKPKLTLHIRSKHLINDFKCKYCDFATSSPKIIYNHKKKFHSSNSKLI